MNYDKKKLEKIIKDIKNDLIIFCENKKLLKQNIARFEQYKSFVSMHKKQKYDASDMLKLANLEFYIAEIDVVIAISKENFRNALFIYDNYFKNVSKKKYLLQDIHDSLNQYINDIKERISCESDFSHCYTIIDKIRDRIPDESYKELELYVYDLNFKYLIEQVQKLTNSKNFELAFKYIERYKDKQQYNSCVNIILNGTKKYIKELYNDPGYPKCKSKVEEFLNNYSPIYKEQVIQYCIELETFTIIKNKLDSYLTNYDFQEADNIYNKNRDLFDENIYKNKKSVAVKQYFKECLNIDINDEQALSLSSLSKNTLVTARAGSGKTRTIACKAIYAIEKEHIKPDEILLLSFNGNAASEMRQRIINDFKYNKFDKDSAKTFHSLAYNIVKPQEELLYDDSDKEVKQNLTKFIDKIYSSKEILTESFKNNLYEYYRWTPDNRDDFIKYWAFKNDDEKYTYLRNKKRVTLSREKVKSNGEKWIADFLFEHDIKYKYEKILTCRKYLENDSNQGLKMYHPDFKIWNSKDQTTYIIEHWGIDENDQYKKVPKYWKKTWDEYYKEMLWKRNIINNAPNIKLIETSICDLECGRTNFEKILKNKLELSGISCNKLSKEEIFERIEDNFANDMAKKFAQFILYAQKENFTPDDIDKKLKNDVFKGNKRCESFVIMANEIYKRYNSKLDEEHRTDFDHILLKATEKIISSHGNCEILLQNKRQKIKDIKMILIDEYQDFSQLFFDMINAILKFNPDIKLYCVGDDWQAINAFAGSNLKFFNDFEKYFPNSGFANLSCNYRSYKNIVESGNQLMKGMGVPSNYINHNEGKIELYYVDDVNIYKDDGKDIDIEFIYDNETTPDQKPFFGIKHRYFKKCIEIISQNPEQSYIMMHRKTTLCNYEELQKFENAIRKYFRKYNIVIDIKVDTVHKFKGMEAENIIILEATDSEFPLIHPDSEIYLIFNRTPQMILDDEKRLFYVALTRARKNIYILAEKSCCSEYITTIKDSINNLEKYSRNQISDEEWEDILRHVDFF